MVTRFSTAGPHPGFQAVKNQMPVEGAHLLGAHATARLIGFVIECSMELMLDTADQQGPGFAKKAARRVRERYAGQGIALGTVLETYARLAPAHFLRTSMPEELTSSNGLTWKEVAPGV